MIHCPAVIKYSGSRLQRVRLQRASSYKPLFTDADIQADTDIHKYRPDIILLLENRISG